MKLIDKLKLMHALSASELAIRTLIIERPVDFITRSKTELLNELGVSSSTLYRFCHKLTNHGFDQVRLQVAQELLVSTPLPSIPTVDVNAPFKPGDSLQTMVSHMASLYQLSVTRTVEQLDLNDLAQAVRTLKQAEEICLITSNTNTLLAERFGNQLKEIGKRVRISASPYKWKLETVSLSERDVLIINSYAGRSSKYFLGLLPDLHHRKVPVLLIGSTHNTSFMPHAQHRLLMCDLEDPKNNLYSFSTDISTEFLFDVLYAALYQEHYEDNLAKHRYIYE